MVETLLSSLQINRQITKRNYRTISRMKTKTSSSRNRTRTRRTRTRRTRRTRRRRGTR